MGIPLSKTALAASGSVCMATQESAFSFISRDHWRELLAGRVYCAAECA